MRRLAGLVVLVALPHIACEEPPSKEIGAAEAAVGRARQDGSERYAPDRLKEADAALAEARRKVQEKDYRGALSSAAEASEKARAAASAAVAAKALTRSSAALAQAEAQARLDEVTAIRQEAAEAKVPEEAFTEVAPLEATARKAAAAVEEALKSGDWLEGQRAAAALKSQVANLPTQFREAKTRWEAEHPKARPRGRTGRPTPPTRPARGR